MMKSNVLGIVFWVRSNSYCPSHYFFKFYKNLSLFLVEDTFPSIKIIVLMKIQPQEKMCTITMVPFQITCNINSS